MIAGLVAGLLAGYAVALPLGAIGSYLITLTARSSLRVGTAAALGVAVTDGLYALLAVLGGTAAAAALAPLAGPLRWTAAAVLLVLAGRALRTARTDAGSLHPVPQRRPIAVFGQFVALTAINPGTLISFTALVIGARLGSTLPPSGRTLFVLGTFVASASWQLCLAAAGVLLGRLLSRRAALLGYCSAGLLAVLAIALVLRPVG
ncbi:MAG TPA: LysE family transporter [Jatrophihabitans sp.]|nr:LysE family transporter [Jatrophihabitans sp.]